MADTVMIQDSIPICPRCGGALRKIQTNTDIIFVCNDSYCKTICTVIDFGQSMRELKCEMK